MQAGREDPFEILQIDESADEALVMAAYRRLMKAAHPDSGGPGASTDEAGETLRRLMSARDDLIDPVRRLEAERRRRSGPRDVPPVAPMTAFDSFFDRLDEVGRAKDVGARGRRGADIEREVTVTLEDVFHGRRMRLSNGAGPCPTCDSSGLVISATARTCHVCEGHGFTRRTKGLITASMPCVHCGGGGRTTRVPCGTCGGSGQATGAGAPFQVPSGPRDVNRILIPGMGAPGHRGGPPGDVHLTVRVAPHPLYGRAGSVLTARVALSVWEASQGGVRRLVGIDGEDVDVPYLPGTSGPTVVVVPGRGMPDFPGRGDLHVTFGVHVPDATREPYLSAFARIAELEAGGASGM